MTYIMDKRLNDHGKNWRHVYKTLILLEYMICCGSESVVNYARDRLYMISTLKQFIRVDAHGYDQGAGVRAKARDIMELLEDEEMLAEARRTRSIPQSRRRASQEPLTLQPVTRNVTQSAAPNHRGSFDDLQNMDEDAALAMALRESKELHEKESQRNSRRSLDASQVYPNFLDNVSRASLAKSSSSLNNINNGIQAQQPASQMTVVSLLDLDDEDFGRSDNRQRSQSMAPSMGPQDLSALYSLNLGNGTSNSGSTNPFQQEFGSHLQPEIDPFGESQFQLAAPAQQRHMSVPLVQPNLSIPKPYMPGQAPVNHVSVAENHIGAKPVMPHQVAPQYGYTNGPQVNTAQHSPRDDEDPFSRL